MKAELPPPCTTLISAATEMGIDKGGEKVRPITIGETIRRWVTGKGSMYEAQV